MTSRALTPNERAIISALLDDGGPGVDNYRTQMVGMRAEDGCTCGCGTIDLVPPADAPRGGHPTDPCSRRSFTKGPASR